MPVTKMLWAPYLVHRFQAHRPLILIFFQLHQHHKRDCNLTNWTKVPIDKLELVKLQITRLVSIRTYIKVRKCLQFLFSLNSAGPIEVQISAVKFIRSSLHWIIFSLKLFILAQSSILAHIEAFY